VVDQSLKKTLCLCLNNHPVCAVSLLAVAAATPPVQEGRSRA
jgi:hypothetical protein